MGGNTAIPRAVSCLLVLAIVAGTMGPRPARAQVADAADETSAADRSADRQRLRALLDRQDVRAQLAAYGVSPDEAAARVAALTDEEVAALAGRLHEVPAGGNPFVVVMALILLWPVALVVLIIAAIAAAAKAAADSQPAGGGGTSGGSTSGGTTGSGWTAGPAKEEMCRNRYLAYQNNWRDRLPDYQACLAR